LVLCLQPYGVTSRTSGIVVSVVSGACWAHVLNLSVSPQLYRPFLRVQGQDGAAINGDPIYRLPDKFRSHALSDITEVAAFNHQCDQNCRSSRAKSITPPPTHVLRNGPSSTINFPALGGLYCPGFIRVYHTPRINARRNSKINLPKKSPRKSPGKSP